jgi:hypothetical protein
VYKFFHLTTRIDFLDPQKHQKKQVFLQTSKIQLFLAQKMKKPVFASAALGFCKKIGKF